MDERVEALLSFFLVCGVFGNTAQVSCGELTLRFMGYAYAYYACNEQDIFFVLYIVAVARCEGDLG